MLFLLLCIAICTLESSAQKLENVCYARSQEISAQMATPDSIFLSSLVGLTWRKARKELLEFGFDKATFGANRYKRCSSVGFVAIEIDENTILLLRLAGYLRVNFKSSSNVENRFRIKNQRISDFRVWHYN